MYDMIYRQQVTAVIFNGLPLQGLAEGASVRIKPLGGNVQVTEGTDGPGINIAAKQGHIIEVDIREDSGDHEYLMDVNRNQAEGGPGVPLALYMGTDRVFSCAEAYVGAPGDLSTGDKKMGKQTYTFITRKSDLY